jgi:hypothetical protein
MSTISKAQLDDNGSVASNSTASNDAVSVDSADSSQKYHRPTAKALASGNKQIKPLIIKELSSISAAMKTGQPSEDDLRGPAQRLAEPAPAIKEVDEEGAELVESVSRNILTALK